MINNNLPVKVAFENDQVLSTIGLQDTKFKANTKAKQLVKVTLTTIITASYLHSHLASNIAHMTYSMTDK